MSICIVQGEFSDSVQALFASDKLYWFENCLPYRRGRKKEVPGVGGIFKKKISNLDSSEVFLTRISLQTSSRE